MPLAPPCSKCATEPVKTSSIHSQITVVHMWLAHISCHFKGQCNMHRLGDPEASLALKWATCAAKVCSLPMQQLIIVLQVPNQPIQFKEKLDLYFILNFFHSYNQTIILFTFFEDSSPIVVKFTCSLLNRVYTLFR